MDHATDSITLRRLVRRVLPSEHDVEDAVQEAWLRALSTPPPRRAGVGGWLHVVAWRIALRTATRDARRAERERIVAARAAPPTLTPFGELARREIRSELTRAVDDLREPYRSALRLRYLEDKSYSDMASDLEMSEASVRSQVKRGLDELRERMAHRRSGFVSIAIALFLWSSRARRRVSLAVWAGAVALAAVLVALLARAEARASEAPARVAALAGVAPERAARGASRESLQPPRAAVPRAASAAREGRTPRTTSATVALSGVVRDPFGSPVAGAEVRVEGRDGGASVRALSDERGRFELADAPRDGWLLAVKDGRTASQRHAVGSLSASQRAGGFDLAVGYGVRPLRVRVLEHDGAPVAGADVVAVSAGTTVWGLQGTRESSTLRVAGVADEDGAFDTWNLGRGAFEVHASHPAHPPAVTTFGRRGATGEELVLRLPAPASVAGVARRADGVAAAGARVLLRRTTPDGAPLRDEAPSAIRATHAAADGSFRLDALAPGPFRLELVDTACDGELSSVVTGALVPGVEHRVAATLDAAWSLRGRALDAAGPDRPLVGWSVAFRAEGDAAGAEERAAVRADGGFALAAVDRPGTLWLLPPGESRIACAVAPCVRPGGEPVVLRPTDGARPSARAAGSFELAGLDGDRPFVDVFGEALVEPVRVAVDPTSGAWTSPLLPPGDYELEGVVPGLGPFALGAWTLVAGETKDVGTLRAPAPRRLFVRTRWRDPSAPRVSFSLARRTPAGTLARLSPGNGSRARGMSLTDEGFVVERVLPGTWDLTVRANGLRTYSETVRVLEGFDAEVVLPDHGESFVRIQVIAPRGLEPGERRTVEVVTAAGERRALDPGDARHRGPIAWLGRSLEPVDCELRVSTTGGLHGSVRLDGDDIRRGRTAFVELR